MKSKDIVHEYFKRVFPEATILVRVNPVDFSGLEITVYPDGTSEKRELQFDEGIEEDLAVDDFKPAGALEFNLYLNGLTNSR
jgi:hypothetical protein